MVLSLKGSKILNLLRVRHGNVEANRIFNEMVASGEITGAYRKHKRTRGHGWGGKAGRPKGFSPKKKDNV
jgi:hypothetical protein